MRAPSALALAVAGLVLAGCGNLVDDMGPPSGLLGISVTAEGHYVLETFVCRDSVDSIGIVRDREGLDDSEENPTVRSYAAARPLTGSVTLDLTQPADGWTPAEPTTFEAQKGYIATAGSSENSTTQLNIDPDELAAMDPGRVYVSNDNLTSKLTGYSPEEFIENSTSACQLDAS